MKKNILSLEQVQLSVDDYDDGGGGGVFCCSFGDMSIVAMAEISKGRVAALLLGGGQGTRLGATYPKGMYDVGLPSRKSLYQLQVYNNLDLQCCRYQIDSIDVSMSSLLSLGARPCGRLMTPFIKRRTFGFGCFFSFLQGERLVKLQQLARERNGAGEGGAITWFVFCFFYRVFEGKVMALPFQTDEMRRNERARYIMTSDHTKEPTLEFLRRHHYFGLDEDDVVVFEQGNLPCFTNDGKIILESKSHVAKAPGIRFHRVWTPYFHFLSVQLPLPLSSVQLPLPLFSVLLPLPLFLFPFPSHDAH